MIKSIISKICKASKHLLVDLRIRWTAKRSPVNVIIGASDMSQPGWIKTDIGHLNVLHEKDWARYFDESSVNAILAEHVFEHLTAEEGMEAARNCFKYLKNNGYIRIAVPDGYFPNRAYIEHVKPMGTGPGSDDHKLLYTYKTLGHLLNSCGFTVKLLEYWDEQGKFHQLPWDAKDGLIHRSRWNDPRNNEEEIAYTSLILDAQKR